MIPFFVSAATPETDTCGHILTEDGDFLDTEDGNRLVTECFVISVTVPIPGVSFLYGGRTVYTKPKRKKPAYELFEEEQEEELEELLSLLGIDL